MIEWKHGLAIVQAFLPSAVSVNLMGLFNNWSTTATPMLMAGHGVWEVRLPLAPSNMQQLCMFVWEKGSGFGQIVDGQTDVVAPFGRDDIGPDFDVSRLGPTRTAIGNAGGKYVELSRARTGLEGSLMMPSR